MKIRKAVYFDSYVEKCPYFTGETNVNNGYGCNHPNQEEKEIENDKKQGKCFCFSCPMGYPADEESLSETDIEWEDGKPELDGMEEDSYIILN